MGAPAFFDEYLRTLPWFLISFDVNRLLRHPRAGPDASGRAYYCTLPTHR